MVAKSLVNSPLILQRKIASDIRLRRLEMTSGTPGPIIQNTIIDGDLRRCTVMTTPGLTDLAWDVATHSRSGFDSVMEREAHSFPAFLSRMHREQTLAPCALSYLFGISRLYRLVC